ncbi:MAG: YodL domain-containing protein [Blautia faecis]
MDMEVNIDHYEVVYIAPLPIHTNRSTFLESVFEKFNLDRPEDFKGHSLSVSDIVAIRENGAVSCYYCDSICFQELPGLIPENYLKNAEMQLEDDYGMIDGVVNNGAKDRKEKAAKDKAEKPSVVEQLKNQPHCEVRKKSTIKYAEQER